MKPPTCGCEAVTHAEAPDTYVVMHCQRHAAVDELLAALEPFAVKDHGHTMSAPRETCPYCAARAATRQAGAA